MNNILDEQIKKSLNHKAENISLDKKVLSEITNKIEKENIYMKKNVLKPRNIIAVAVAVLTLCTVGVIGAGKVASIESHSYNNEEIHHFPTKNEVTKLVDYTPKYTETLGKYKFKSASPSESIEKDDNGNKIHNYKDICFWYNTDEGILNLSTSPELSQPDYSNYNYEIINFNGINLYYNTIKYKFVPPDYELTEEDKKLKEAKELEISYGSQEVEYSSVSSINWSENGVKYCLMDMDVNIPKAELIEMAKEVINSK